MNDNRVWVLASPKVENQHLNQCFHMHVKQPMNEACELPYSYQVTISAAWRAACNTLQ